MALPLSILEAPRRFHLPCPAPPWGSDDFKAALEGGLGREESARALPGVPAKPKSAVRAGSLEAPLSGDAAASSPKAADSGKFSIRSLETEFLLVWQTSVFAFKTSSDWTRPRTL